MDLDQLPLSALVEGFVAQGEDYRCISCGKVFEEGEILALDGRYFQGRKAATVHVAQEHPARLAQWMEEEERYLSLTDKQKDILLLFAAGLTDGEAAKELGISPSTVRHQRFMFRERAKAAKLYLAAWSLVEQGKSKARETIPFSHGQDEGEALISPHKGARMVDERYVLTQQEEEKILSNVFHSLQPLKLKVLSSKEKKKVVILGKIAQEFTPDTQYPEAEINGILKEIYPDFATLRRYLIEYGFMARTPDCKTYWRLPI